MRPDNNPFRREAYCSTAANGYVCGLRIRRSQREGIDAAKAKGKHLGRPRVEIPEEFPIVYDDWKKGKHTAKFAMQRLGLKSSSFYRIVKQYETNMIQ